MKKFFFRRCWETEFSCEVEAESLEEAIRIAKEDTSIEWWNDHGDDLCTSTTVEEYDEDGDLGDPIELDFDFSIKE